MVRAPTVEVPWGSPEVAPPPMVTNWPLLRAAQGPPQAFRNQLRVRLLRIHRLTVMAWRGEAIIWRERMPRKRPRLTRISTNSEWYAVFIFSLALWWPAKDDFFFYITCLFIVSSVLQHIESRLRITLPDDLASSLQDGVVLCHIANHVKPRAVPSIHVPSPAVVSF